MQALTRTVVIAFVLLLALPWTAALAAGRSALQSELVVDATIDDVDAKPGDGACATARRDCTLRAALQEANALPGRQTVVIPPGVFRLTRPGAFEDAGDSGDLDVTGDVDLRGAGVTTTMIVAVALDRVLDIGPRTRTLTATISNVTLRGGAAPNEVLLENTGGGGVRIGNASQVSIQDSVITENTTTTDGGGLLNLGQVRLTRTAVTYNVAEGQGGGIATIGGASRLALHQTLIDGNEAHAGAGILISGPLDDLPRRAGVTIRRSTISHNRCANIGGGVLADRGTLTIESSTISGNVCGSAGGILNDGGTVVTLRFSTISGNRAELGGGIMDVHGEGADRFRLEGSILAGNLASQFPDCYGPLTSLGSSLVGSDDGCFADLGPDDLVNVAPRLSPLERYGPFSFGHRPLRDSPALDAAGTCPLTDQRGQLRPLDGDGDGVARCDMGAVEAEYVPVTIFLPQIQQ